MKKINSCSIPLSILCNIKNVKEVYSYLYNKHPQYFIINKLKNNKYCVNGFVYTTGIADWIEKRRVKNGATPTVKKYQQNVWIDYDRLKDAREFILSRQ